MTQTSFQIGEKHSRGIYYAAILFVVFFWGFSAVIYTYLYRYYSASVLSTIMTFFSALFFFFLSRKKLKLLDKRYLKIALPICGINAVACVMQRIGLQYTTPANYAFLEHLACVVTPIAVFAFTRKRPGFWESAGSVLCLVGCFVLSGVGSAGGIAFGVGDILCGVAGVLLGICVAAVGAYTQKIDVILFMLIHTSMYFVVSLISTVVLNSVTMQGVPMETAVMTWDLPLLLAVVTLGVTDIALCWLLRTQAIRHIGSNTVVILAPFSAVITGIVSVCLGIDRITLRFAIGGSLIFVAALLPDVFRVLRMRQCRKKKSGKTL